MNSFLLNLILTVLFELRTVAKMSARWQNK